MFMWFRVMLNVVSSVSFGPMFDESVALNLNVHGFTVMLMLMNSSVSVVFSFIVISRVVWFTLCVVLVMLSVRFSLNGVVLRLLVSLSVMLNDGSVVSIAVVLCPLMVGWMSCMMSVSL